MNPVWKLNFFLFNIEGYGEFFSGITPMKRENSNLYPELSVLTLNPISVDAYMPRILAKSVYWRVTWYKPVIVTPYIVKYVKNTI